MGGAPTRAGSADRIAPGLNDFRPGAAYQRIVKKSESGAFGIIGEQNPKRPLRCSIRLADWPQKLAYRLILIFPPIRYSGLTPMTSTVPTPAPLSAPVLFLGIQPGFDAQSAIELYVLLAPVGHHPVGSTVSRQTLERHGYQMDIDHRAQKQASAQS